jgi:hypothetical protein
MPPEAALVNAESCDIGAPLAEARARQVWVRPLGTDLPAGMP